MSPILESDPNASFGIKDAFTVLLGGVMALFGIVHRGLDKRVEKLEDAVNTKADAKQVLDSFNEVFRELRDVRKDVAEYRIETRDGLQAMERTLRESIERTIRTSIERNSLE